MARFRWGRWRTRTGPKASRDTGNSSRKPPSPCGRRTSLRSRHTWTGFGKRASAISTRSLQGEPAGLRRMRPPGQGDRRQPPYPEAVRGREQAGTLRQPGTDCPPRRRTPSSASSSRPSPNGRTTFQGETVNLDPAGREAAPLPQVDGIPGEPRRLFQGPGDRRRRDRARDAEEKLKVAAAEWRNTFDAARDLVFILDSDFRVVRANAAAERFFRLPGGRWPAVTATT